MESKRLEDLILELQSIKEKYGNVPIWGKTKNGSKYYQITKIEVKDLDKHGLSKKRLSMYSPISKEDTHIAEIELDLSFEYK
jgi:hypothetical protein